MRNIFRFNRGGVGAGLALLLGLAGCLGSGRSKILPIPADPCGPTESHGVVVPVNQVLTPAGERVQLPRVRPQVLALSPDGRMLVTAGSHTLTVLDPATGRPLHRDKKPVKSDPTYTGLVFSADGRRLYLADASASVQVFAVGADCRLTLTNSIPLASFARKDQPKEVPSGLALSADGTRLYVVLNLSDRLVEFEAATGRPLRQFPVGVAPYGVVVAAGKAYVSNWGGRRPDATSVTGPGGAGVAVRVDAVRYVANEGSVSIIDLRSGQTVRELVVGLHPSGLAVTPDGRHVLVANAGSDTVSVIDTWDDRLVETILMRWHPDHPLGVSPNALTLDRSGRTLYVCNGTQNAIAVVAFDPPQSQLRGLIPTDWYPGAIVYDGRREALAVANIKGIGAWNQPRAGDPRKYNSHDYFGTLTLVKVPSRWQLAAETRQVLGNDRLALAEQASLPPRPGQPPRPVPERVGEPSLFQHVVYVIKENRTYDQVLGDLPQGNGDPSLCVFGEKITPNQHQLCREFVLLDNIYCSGVLSADGHQWTDSAFVTDYLEKSFFGFPRSYPFRGEDALAASPAGFIWDAARAHGKSFLDYGEFTRAVVGWTDPQRQPPPRWLDYYHDFVNQTKLTRIGSQPNIASLAGHVATNSVGWELSIPDVVRADRFIQELHEFERQGTLPDLLILYLPSDHTAGTGAGYPTPAAMVADNDLALGRVVEAISHSRFWSDTCLFAIEDDPQAGWDHVSGYRTTAYVASAYTRRHAVVSANYNQTSLLRTIELILGLPPLNQFDASATPLTACFTDQPDLTPYTVVTNNVPLDQMNPEPAKISDAQARALALASAKLPLAEPDRCPEDLLNRILWCAQKGSRTPYPAWAIRPRQAGDEDAD